VVTSSLERWVQRVWMVASERMVLAGSLPEAAVVEVKECSGA
jgi:hypothetical protein